MTDSILNSIKEPLGLSADYTPFDQELMMHINSVFSTLTQLGVGPVAGFSINSNTAIWADYLTPDHDKLNDVKTYMYLRVRMIFDVPTSQHAIAAFKEQIKEAEWRLNVTVDSEPLPPLVPIGDSDGSDY